VAQQLRAKGEGAETPVPSKRSDIVPAAHS
jgi:hypothetical protein